MGTDAPWYKGTRGEWYVVVQAVLFVLIGIGPRSLAGFGTWTEPYATIATWVGLTLMLVGAALSLSGVLRLGTNLTALPYPKDDSQLVETGVYGIVRHPIYSGLIIGALGWGLWLNAGLTLLFALGLFVLFDLKLRREERWLCERYPGYDEYQKRVKKLIPWVW